MQLGKLIFQPVESHFDLVAEATHQSIRAQALQGVYVSAMDERAADTAAFCEQYDIGLDVSANCVIVEARRGDKVWHAACIILATTKADVNGSIRRHLDARKISFAPMDTATSLTGMMYGGITPIGLPADWPIIIDTHVHSTKYVIIGSGLRKSKLLVPGNLFSELPNAIVMDITKSATI